MRITLYTTSACHLCELAEELLQASPRWPEVALEKIEISDSDLLMQRYGIRIPVLRREDGTELGWPFGAAELEGFLGPSTTA